MLPFTCRPATLPCYFINDSGLKEKNTFLIFMTNIFLKTQKKAVMHFSWGCADESGSKWSLFYEAKRYKFRELFIQLNLVISTSKICDVPTIIFSWYPTRNAFHLHRRIYVSSVFVYLRPLLPVVMWIWISIEFNSNNLLLVFCSNGWASCRGDITTWW